MQQVTVEEASFHLTELMEAAVGGEEIFITKENGVSVRLVPHRSIVQEPVRKKRQFGNAKGLMTMAPNFDAPLDDFKEYME